MEESKKQMKLKFDGRRSMGGVNNSNDPARNGGLVGIKKGGLNVTVTEKKRSSFVLHQEVKHPEGVLHPALLGAGC